ncbi:hypothetical protein IT402_02090 [Candidatus Nomurabacteria bacterium]|nr:hypothetical protein [Candidatus Nomurabacteria bacterium]
MKKILTLMLLSMTVLMGSTEKENQSKKPLKTKTTKKRCDKCILSSNKVISVEDISYYSHPFKARILKSFSGEDTSYFIRIDKKIKDKGNTVYERYNCYYLGKGIKEPVIINISFRYYLYYEDENNFIKSINIFNEPIKDSFFAESFLFKTTFYFFSER